MSDEEDFKHEGRTVEDEIRVDALRNTSCETLWSWDEIEGAIEIKAFQGGHWGSKVGVRISSWLEDVAELADVEAWVATAVARLTGVLTGGEAGV